MSTTDTTAEHTEVSLVELRSSIGDLINRVAYGHERVMVTRNGKPAAALISADELAYFKELENAADRAALDAARAADDGYRISVEDYAASRGLNL